MSKRSVLITFILFMLVLSGCDPTDQYAISYKINGTTWYSSSAPAIVNGSNLSVDAISTLQNQKHTVFLFSQFGAVGTYQLDHINNIFMYTNDGDTATSFYAQSFNPATLKITEFDGGNKKVVGEFYGRLYTMGRTDSILITDGKFHLRYQ